MLCRMFHKSKMQSLNSEPKPLLRKLGLHNAHSSVGKSLFNGVHVSLVNIYFTLIITICWEALSDM